MKDIDQSESELLHQLAVGDPGAFTKVYRQFYQQIYHFAKTFLPDREDAEDITADSFVKLWNRRDSFNSMNNIRSFLHITARNSCFDFLRHIKVKTEKQAELIKQFETDQYTDFSITEIREELMKLIQDELENMSVKMKEIFLLSFEEGLTPTQIAANLHISVQTVSNQKTNAIRSLKKALASKVLLRILIILLECGGLWLP